MSAITILGSPRRACLGPTRRETLKVGALSLLGGLFNTLSILALEDSAAAKLRPARAKSVVLLYLQGGPPTQDMFDLKPAGAGRRRRRIQADRHAVPRAIEVGELSAADGALDAQIGDRSQRVSQRRMPQEPADVHRLRRESCRTRSSATAIRPAWARSAPTSSAIAQKELPTYAYLPCPLGWGEVRKKAGPHGGFLGRRYDPFCTECTAYVDHPPDDIWSRKSCAASRA